MAEKLKSKIISSHDDHSDSDSDEDRNTSDHEHLGLPLEKLSLGPRKKLLVLGLGGLLCHRVYRYGSMSNIPRSRYADASYGSFYVYKRPYCEEFMKFCLERFEVGIWSSAREWYLDNALDCVMKGLRRKLLFAWDQVECTDSGFKTLEKRDKPLYLKDLKKLWNKDSKAKLPMGKYSKSNTLLIDNVPYKALLNPPHTAIFPTEYKVDQIDDKDLGPEGELRIYLAGLADAANVAAYVKEHPFGQPAITASHSDWRYYSKVINRFQKT